MTAPLIFLDTETTGLAPWDDIWEVGAIRHDPDGSESSLHLFVDHDRGKCEQLPEPFLSDHRARYPGDCGNAAWSPPVATALQMCDLVASFTRRRATDEPRPHIIGAVPSFDTARLESLFLDLRLSWDWHYHLTDVENLVAGYLLGTAEAMSRSGNPDVTDRAVELREIATPPYDSDELSRAVGVYPDDFERHTALGDASWARALYDAVRGSRFELEQAPANVRNSGYAAW